MTTTNPSGPHRQGDPEIPEERNPLGHDAQPEPREAKVDALHPADVDVSTKATIPVGKESALASGGWTKLDDAKFLADEFDMPARKAAGNVLNKDSSAPEVSNLAKALQRDQRQSDALAGVPTPEGTPGVTPGKEGAGHLRPIVHSPNRRSGGG